MKPRTQSTTRTADYRNGRDLAGQEVVWWGIGLGIIGIAEIAALAVEAMWFYH